MTHGHHASGAAATFVAAWTVMMAAMMLPSLAPALWRFYRAAAAAGARRPAPRTALVGAAYLGVWSTAGAAVHVLASIPALHIPPAIVVLIAGALQLSPWKARRLARCRAAACPDDRATAGAGAAWRHGLRLGVRCLESCAGLTAALLAVGAMDLGAMVAVTAAVTAERLAPDGARVARATGVALVGAAVLMLARAA